jgi:hypothetical protein
VPCHVSCICDIAISNTMNLILSLSASHSSSPSTLLCPTALVNHWSTFCLCIFAYVNCNIVESQHVAFCVCVLSLHTLKLHSFLFSNNISMYCYHHITTIYLSIYQFMNFWVVSTSLLLQMVLWWAFV